MHQPSTKVLALLVLLAASALPGFTQETIAAAVPATGQTGIETMGDARFTVISPTLVRLEQGPEGAFIDAPSWFAANRQARCQTYVVKKDGAAFSFDTGKMKLTYTPNGKPFGPDNLKIELTGGPAWAPGMQNKGNLGGTIRTLDGWTNPGSLGEGVLSTDGWYLLDDSNSHLIVNDWPAARPAGHGTDWYFFGYGKDFKQGLRDLTLAGGTIPLPRKALLGCWYSRYWNYSADDYKKLVAEYREHDFPLDVMVMDMDWHLYDVNYPKNDPRFKGVSTWTGYTFDPNLIPDPKGLAQWFHQQGLAVTLNDHPAAGIQRHEACYPDFMKAMGADPATGQAIPFDAGDKHYMDTFWKYSHQPKEEMGFDFWWLDWQQYPHTKSIPTLTNLSALNRYYFNATAQNGKRGTSFSRWAGWGDHRYPIHFSGDANSNWKLLGFEAAMTATAGNVGCFYWSHDIGGHWGGRFDEMYARWVQFGAMSPALRSHSTRNAELDRRPWTYQPWACESMRRSFHLRAELMPYIYTSVWQGHSQSLPLCRPMYLEGGPTNEAQQYQLGDHLIFAPISMPGHGPGKLGWQELWLPAGDEWVNWFTGERFNGGQHILVPCDINTFPLFVRAGAAIPMQPYTERPTSAKPDTLVLLTTAPSAGKTVKSLLYEDDGLTNKYLQGECVVSELDGKPLPNKKIVKKSPPQGTPAELTLRAAEQRLEAVLGKPVKLEKLTDGLQYAEGDLQVSVLAALGIALVEHNNHPYLWNGPYELRFYDTYGLVKNPPVPSGSPIVLPINKETANDLVLVPGRNTEAEQPIEIAGRKFTLKCSLSSQTQPTPKKDRPKATASSTENGYNASGAADGIANGYPNNNANEWAAGGEKAGAWIKLEWPEAKTASGVLVYDRPNPEDQVLAATIAFDDGSTVAIGELPNDGKTPAKLTFPPRKVKSLTLKVDKVSATTKNAGIAEIALIP